MPEHLQDLRPEYWQSPQEREAAGAPAPAAPAGSDEFPAGAAEAPQGLSRRQMLQLTGASLALGGLAACRRPVEAIVPYVDPPEEIIPGRPALFATSMPLGTAAYGMLVESHEGRPTKIEGNELHPASRGAASAWMQAALLDLYDPDRARRVLARPQGSSTLVEASWEKFAGFWSHLRPDLEANQGEGLAVLAEASASPTLTRLRERFLERFPRSRWAVHEPFGDVSALHGVELATGRRLRPLHDLTDCRTIVALDADFLHTESDAVRLAGEFAASRDPARGAAMSRLWVVESGLSVTGAAADHRLRLPARQIGRALLALGLALRDEGVPVPLPAEAPPPELPAGLAADLRTLARELARSANRSALLVGHRQPPAVHALALACSVALGALGTSLRLAPVEDTANGDPSAVRSLLDGLRGGETETLVCLGGNPAYTLPADLGFGEAATAASTLIYLGTHEDETTEYADWHLPQAHFLESWGDVRAHDGTLGIVQPLIAPLHGGRSAVELLGYLADGRNYSGYDRVREVWLERVLGGSGFEERWRRALHDGLLAAERPPVGAVSVDTAALREAVATLVTDLPPQDGLELELDVSRSVLDGRFANNVWLQELPDPITKQCWGNAALLAPRTAAELGVEDGDVVRLELDDGAVEAPALIVPGQSERTVGLALGYGRRGGGASGRGVGVDAGRLRRSDAPWFRTGLTVERTGRRQQLTRTQGHWRMEGRQLVREIAAGAPPAARREPGGEARTTALWQPFDYSRGEQWGMAIDLNACIGCNACVLACQAENNIPVVGPEQVRRGREMHWIRLDRYFEGELDNPHVVFQPVPCMHCETAPCEEVCPVAATVHSPQGLNLMVYNRCIGTRYCSNNCPYKVRRFNFFNYTKDLPELVRMAMNPDVTVRSRGVMEKCTYCLQRLNAATRAAKRQGRKLADGEVRTACQQTCPTRAISFGNLNDPRSAVVQAKADDRGYELLEELNTRPRTSYLARVRNPSPEVTT